MKAAILAAGQGERLKAQGASVPKPLLRVGTLPLIEHALNSARAAGCSEVACIINQESAAVETHCREHVADLSLEFLHRTTPSSMESLFALAPLLGETQPFLLLTVDAIIAPGAVCDFVRRANARARADGVLAVTRFVDDEKPLRVETSPDGRITTIGGSAAGPLVTAGFYVFRPAIFAEIPAARDAGLTALRQFLAHLVARGYALFAELVPKCVDVDRPEDVAAAEAFLRSGYRA